jgi:hypothetical protein
VERANRARIKVILKTEHFTRFQYYSASAALTNGRTQFLGVDRQNPIKSGLLTTRFRCGSAAQHAALRHMPLSASFG